MRVVVAGALANKPGYGGEAWVRIAWARGLAALGADVVFVEQWARPDGPAGNEDATRFFEETCAFGGLAGRASLITPAGFRLAGLSTFELVDFAAGADLLVNISGNLTFPPVFKGVRRRAYVDLDPGYTQFWHASGAADLGLDAHDVHFTVGENVGTAVCAIPTAGLEWLPVRQPVQLDQWPQFALSGSPTFTTVASWRGAYGSVEFGGRTYGPKAHQFRRVAALPSRVPVPLEIALDIDPADATDRSLLEKAGWVLTDPRAVGSPDAFRDYVRASAAEFSVAQTVYVGTRSGWFSDRSARYLATGRPVVVQDTGVERTLPVGEGLLTFRTPEEAARAIHDVVHDYDRHACAARGIAEEFFDARKVLETFLDRAVSVRHMANERPFAAPLSLRSRGRTPRPRSRVPESARSDRTLVVSGMVAGVPDQGGATWAVLQYVLGLRRLGWDVYFVEQVRESELQPPGEPLAASENARYFRALMRAFGLEGKAALIRADSEESVGMSRSELRRVVARAEVLLNLSGRLADAELRERIPIRAYLDLDPAFTQLWRACDGAELGLEGHTHYVTVGLEVGGAGCPIPTMGLDWIATLPPVVLDEWPVTERPDRDAWTTVANWRGYGSIQWKGVHYGQKAHAFRDLFGLPGRTGDRFELALAIHADEVDDLAALRSNGWRLLDPRSVVSSPEGYRRFVRGSAAELGVAKTGYVNSRCGWFSDRSACYLAAGRPVVAQDTGFSSHLPVGRGLLSFETLDEAVEAVGAVRGDYPLHARAARGVAEEHLDSDRVLSRLLREIDA